MQKIIIFLLLVTGLTGCVAPIPANEMVANKNIYTQINKTSLHHQVAVDKVTLSPAMPTAGIIVTSEEFSKALTMSLEQAGWYAKGTQSNYGLSANFIGFDQPFTLFNTKIFSEVNYTVENKRTGKTVYQETIKIPCVLGIGDVFDANLRQIETLKCSIRENVTHLIRDLNSKF